MANFTTHIGVGTLVSGALATLTLAADIVAPENLVAVTVAGVLGSILPDIDLKESKPSRALFSGLAAFFSFATLFSFADSLSIAENWLLALAAFLFVRYVAHGMFHRMSYHRGIYHSLLAAVFFALLTAVIYKWVLGRHDGVAWLAAAFMLVGFLVHLTLDEMYSVDVMDTRIKSSFGTALKPVDFKHMGHTSAMAVATVIAFLLAPPINTFVDGMAQRSLWSGLQQKMLPSNGWFWGLADTRKLVERLPGLANSVMGTSPIATGSVAPAPSPATSAVPQKPAK